MARILLRWALFSSPSPFTPPLIKLRRTHQTFSPIKAFSFSTTNTNATNINYLTLTDEELMSQCDLNTFKASGPGGQHRNKRESAVRLKHIPTGIVAQAVEDRSQHKNRASALRRLRTLLALKDEST